MTECIMILVLWVDSCMCSCLVAVSTARLHTIRTCSFHITKLMCYICATSVLPTKRLVYEKQNVRTKGESMWYLIGQQLALNSNQMSTLDLSNIQFYTSVLELLFLWECVIMNFQVPTINQENAIPGREPNETLKKFRSDAVLPLNQKQQGRVRP